MPVQLQSYSTKQLDPYKLLQDLRNIVDAVNKSEVGVQQNTTNLQRVTQALNEAAAAQGGGGGLPPAPVGPFPSVYVDPNGAILGDGTALNPLRCSVDGVTIQIIGNQLVAVATTQECSPLTDGDPTQPELVFAGGDVIMVCVP